MNIAVESILDWLDERTNKCELSISKSDADKDVVSREEAVLRAIGELRAVIYKNIAYGGGIPIGNVVDQWRHDHFHGERDGSFSGEYLTRASQILLARRVASVQKDNDLQRYAKNFQNKIKEYYAKLDDEKWVSEAVNEFLIDNRHEVLLSPFNGLVMFVKFINDKIKKESE